MVLVPIRAFGAFLRYVSEGGLERRERDLNVECFIHGPRSCVGDV